MKLKITYKNNSASYTCVEDFSDAIKEGYKIYEGRWHYPFPNKKGNSLAFGLAESFLQSDGCPQSFHENGVEEIIVQRIT